MSAPDLIIFRNELLLLIRSSELSSLCNFVLREQALNIRVLYWMCFLVNKKVVSKNIFIHSKIFYDFLGKKSIKHITKGPEGDDIKAITLSRIYSRV